MTASAAPLRLLVLEGDGIGPEIAAATTQVLAAVGVAVGVEIAFDTAAIGFPALRTRGTTFPAEVLEAARAADGVILGPGGMSAWRVAGYPTTSGSTATR